MVTYLDVDRPVAGATRVARRRLGFLARDRHVAYAFIAPAFFLLAVLVAYPFVLSVWFSLSDARIGSAGRYIGLDNFSHLLTRRFRTPSSSPLRLSSLRRSWVSGWRCFSSASCTSSD
jgi:ABC-type sugar transport system permease subunit